MDYTKHFSTEYDRVVAVKAMENGAIHVGWITNKGQLVDLTNILSKQKSDFADPIVHRTPQFGADGRFYFINSNDRTLMRVDPNR